MEMDWETYLAQKKIDAAAYKKGDPQQYGEFQGLFLQMHPASFTAQKLFLINSIRRTYPLQLKEAEKPAAKKAGRPVFKPKTR